VSNTINGCPAGRDAGLAAGVGRSADRPISSRRFFAVRLEIGRSVLLPPREARRDQQTKSVEERSFLVIFVSFVRFVPASRRLAARVVVSSCRRLVVWTAEGRVITIAV